MFVYLFTKKRLCFDETGFLVDIDRLLVQYCDIHHHTFIHIPLSICINTQKAESMSDQTTSESPEASSSFDIKTHFPAARIKKLMQSDEDIGKVAQATPVVVGRALEFFLANLVQASAEQAKISGTKRVTAQHVKSAIQSDDKFDFLVDTICSTEAKEE